jgi:hypothetical protein
MVKTLGNTANHVNAPAVMCITEHDNTSGWLGVRSLGLVEVSGAARRHLDEIEMNELTRSGGNSAILNVDHRLRAGVGLCSGKDSDGTAQVGATLAARLGYRRRRLDGDAA